MKLTPYWHLGGEPHCEVCIKAVTTDEAVYGGYPIETDRATTCPRCGRELDLTYIGEENEEG